MKVVKIEILVKTSVRVADDYNFYEISNFVRRELSHTGLHTAKAEDIDVKEIDVKETP